MGELLPDVILTHEIKKPTEGISLPILYYAVMLMLDVIIKAALIH